MREANVRVQAQRLIDSYLFEGNPWQARLCATYGCVSNGPFAPSGARTSEASAVPCFRTPAKSTNWLSSFGPRIGTPPRSKDMRVYSIEQLSEHDAFGQTPGAATADSRPEPPLTFRTLSGGNELVNCQSVKAERQIPRASATGRAVVVVR